MFERSAKAGVGCTGQGPGEDNLDGGNPACRVKPNRNKERQETEMTQYDMRLWIQPYLKPNPSLGFSALRTRIIPFL